jgi:exodeoxyribonuclease VII small subunit
MAGSAPDPVAAPDPTATSDPGAAPDDEAKPFEALLNELEALTDRLASGELGIEAATDLYERAEHLHVLATRRLAQVQERFDRRRNAVGGRGTGPAPG